MYNYVKNPRYFIDDKFKVGDFTGEGEINCKDFCWVVSCYTKGVGETYGGNKGNVTMANKNSFIKLILKYYKPILLILVAPCTNCFVTVSTILL